MLSFPIDFQEDDGGVLATSPDFPELTTFGDDRREALARSVSALEEAIAARMHGNQDVPVPSAGDVCVALPTLTAGEGDFVSGHAGTENRQSRIGAATWLAPPTGGSGIGCRASFAA